MTSIVNKPNLKTLNFQYAALKRIEAVVKEGMAFVKEAHLQALLADAENTGGKQWGVDIDGEKIATVSLSGGTSKPLVVDEGALIEWAMKNRPDLVDTRPRLSSQAAGTLKQLIAGYADGAALTADGEVVPGVSEGRSTVYQSLRFANSKTTDGKAKMEDFIAQIGLPALIEDIASAGGE